MSQRLNPSRLVWIYGTLAALWILVSDALLILVFPDDSIQGWIELAKGLLFVVVTSLVLYLLLRSWWQDLRRAFDSQHQSEERLRQLSPAIEQSPNSILITDLEARIQYVNEAFLNTTGYEPLEVLGNNPRLLQSGQTPPETYMRLEPAASPDYSLTLSVADNGIGMSEEVRSQLFRPFGQAETSTTRRFGGTGLGLTICKRLVDLMGGAIEVESTPDVGTTFRVHLPLEPAQAPESEPSANRYGLEPATVATDPAVTETSAASPSEPSQERRLLVAEDDEINQEVIQLQLEMLGYRADLAANGVEALELWRTGRGRYLALLTDLHMPEMDGYDLTAAIRRDEAERGGHGERLPILALTANALRGEAERTQELGLDDYLTKPLMLEDLERALKHWLGTDSTDHT